MTGSLIMPYFDHSATTPIHSQVLELLQEINSHHFGNPSSIHRYGQKARAIIEQARKQVAQSIGCRPAEIIFTSGGTEANNMVLWNQLNTARKHVVVSAIEHPSILVTLKKLAKHGIECTRVRTDSAGLIDPQAIDDAIRTDTGLVSVMLANNEIGTIQPIPEIAQITRSYKIPFHTDAIQAIGKLPVDVHDLMVDFLTISGHKFYGPKGAGALYRRPGQALQPLIMGGGQEQNLRSGTENVAGIAGLGLAAKLAQESLGTTREHLLVLEEHFINCLTPALSGFILNGHPERHLPGLLSITIPQVPADVLIISLDLAGMAISNGSACSSGTVQSSHVLESIGLTEEQNRHTIRISFGRDNTIEEVEQLAEKLIEIAVRR